GFSGGILLVAGQAIIFLAYRRRHQPILQALFAIGSVVAPATIAPALQGWLLDSQSWLWIFFSVVPVSLAAAGFLLLADCPAPVKVARRRRLVRERFADPVVRRIRPCIHPNRRRPAPVAERRAFHRRASHRCFPHADPAHSSDRDGALGNPDDHGRDVDAVRFDH
ncbi:MAG: multidrug efflux MFS transporter, partial [Mesorhizobium sp.]